MIEIKNGKYQEIVYLPSKFVDKLNNTYTGLKLNDAIIAAKTVYNKSKEVGKKHDEYFELCSTYIIKALPVPRNKIWGQMVKDDIFEVYHYENGTTYKTDDTCKKYRIKPEYLEGKLVKVEFWISYINKSIETKMLKAIEKLSFEVPSGCTIDQMIEADRPKIEKSIKKELKINYLNHTAIYNKSKINVPARAKKNKETFENWLKTMIEDKIREKIKYLTNIVNKLHSGDIAFPHRNFTNNRLDHIITGFPSKYLDKCLLEEKNIIEFDINNSQFCLFANYISNSQHNIYKHMHINNKNTIKAPINLLMGLTNEPDVKKFIDACKQGCLYELIMNELGLSNRKKVKKMFMAFFFGNVKFDNKDRIYSLFKLKFKNVLQIINVLKLYYASVYKLTDDKKLLRLLYTHKTEQKSRFDAGNDYLAIGLQRVESEIFIDNIVKALQNAGLTIISKHDSILCKEDEADHVEIILKQQLDRILGENNYKYKKNTLSTLSKSKKIA